jgi:ATP-dependent Clp protease protease subunit
VRTRNALVRGSITELSAVCCMNRLFYLAAQEPGRPILIEISSPGGSKPHTLAVIRTMTDVECPIATFCKGKIGTGAAMIAAHGMRGQRVAAPTARFTLAMPAKPLNRGWQEVPPEQVMGILIRTLAVDTGKTEAVVEGWLRQGVEFTAQQALANGLIDAIAAAPTLPQG